MPPPATWKTLFTSKFASLRLPIMGPPMIGVSGGKWAAAIQQAGGLGFLAAGHLLPNQDEALAHQIELYRTQMEQNGQDPNFLALGFIGHSATPARPEAWERYEDILATQQPKVVQFFAPAVTHHPLQQEQQQQQQQTNVSLAQEYGAIVMAQVGNVEHAQQALDAGVDALIVQGAEAGGHGLRPPLGRALLPLLADVKALVGQRQLTVPILAAGGITTGATAAAALCAGAHGVVLGTRLWASREALGHDAYKQALVEAASCDDVIRTTVMDQIQNSYVSSFAWPQPFDSLGVLQNDVTRTWDGRTEDLARELEEASSSSSSSSLVATNYAKACQMGNVQQGAVLTGQGVGQLHSIDSVADILARIEEEMIESIQALSENVIVSPEKE